MDIHGSRIHMDIHLHIFNELMIRHGHYIDTSIREELSKAVKLQNNIYYYYLMMD